METELPLTKLEPRSALGMNISQRIPGQAYRDLSRDKIVTAWPEKIKKPQAASFKQQAA